MRFRRLSAILIVCVLGSSIPAEIPAGEWPQILGPNRNGIAVGEKLPDSFPAKWPPRKWDLKVGSGFAGVAVMKDQAVIFHRQGDREVAQSLNAKTGEEIWNARFPTSYRPSIVPNDGPLCVPTITEKHVILFGASGGLRCLNRKTGKTLWQHETHDQYGASAGYFGAGSCPIVVDGLVLVNVGAARNQAGIVAFRLDTGKEAWKAVDDQASYSSPVLTTVDGKNTVVFVTRLKALAIDAKTGGELWETRFGQRGPTVNGAAPVIMKDHIFLTASYGIGAVFAKFNRSEFTPLWSSDEILSSQYTTSVAYNGKLFGVDGRQDQGYASLVCIDPEKQKILWRKDDFGYATLILANDKLLAMKTDGTLVVVKADTELYRPLREAKLFESTTRALPALSNGRLFVRDESTLACFEVGSKAK